MSKRVETNVNPKVYLKELEEYGPVLKVVCNNQLIENSYYAVKVFLENDVTYTFKCNYVPHPDGLFSQDRLFHRKWAWMIAAYFNLEPTLFEFYGTIEWRKK